MKLISRRKSNLDVFPFLEKLAQQSEQQRPNNKAMNNNTTSSQSSTGERERTECPEHLKKERIESPPNAFGQNVRETPPQDVKPWGYSGIDLMNTGAAFWQNYSGESYFWFRLKIEMRANLLSKREYVHPG